MTEKTLLLRIYKNLDLEYFHAWSLVFLIGLIIVLILGILMLCFILSKVGKNGDLWKRQSVSHQNPSMVEGFQMRDSQNYDFEDPRDSLLEGSRIYESRMVGSRMAGSRMFGTQGY